MAFETATVTHLNELIAAIDAIFAADVAPSSAVEAALDEIKSNLQGLVALKTAQALHSIKFYVYRAIKTACEEALVQNPGLTVDDLIPVIAAELLALSSDPTKLVQIAQGVITE